MLVEGEMLRNALKARKEPPKAARAPEERKVEVVAASGEESAREAAVAPIVEEPKKMSQGEFVL